MKRSPLPAYYPYGFAVSEEAWRRFSFDELPGALGSAGKAEAVHAAQLLAGRLHGAMPEGRAARSGELLAMGLIGEALRAVAYSYCTEVRIGAFGHALAYAGERTEPGETLTALLGQFPPVAARVAGFSTAAYLADVSGPIAGASRVALEAVLLALVNENPAMRPYAVLHDDSSMQAKASYGPTLNAIETFFAKLPPTPARS